jgi:hypothetical protein
MQEARFDPAAPLMLLLLLVKTKRRTVKEVVVVSEFEPRIDNAHLSQRKQTLGRIIRTYRFWIITGGLAVIMVIAIMIQLPENNATTAVKRSITAVSSLGRTYLAGSLKGGTAVLVDDLAAYWVKNSRVYAANGFAKTWSPSISYATDPDINFDSVEQAVK